MLDDVATIVDEFLMLTCESAEFHFQDEVKSVLLEANRLLVATKRQLEAASERYLVAVVGLSNVGKSTLLNALLGAELTPRCNGPCTAVPVEFHHGDIIRLTVLMRNGLARPTWVCSDLSEVHRRLTSVVDDTIRSSTKEIRKLVVEAPIPLLDNGLILADTPGFGAAQLGDALGSHESALERYLKDEVSQVFWVVLAEQGIGGREKAFHDSSFAEVCDDVVVTGCEDWDLVDRARFRKRFGDVFGSRMPRFHFVSALRGVEAQRVNDIEAVESAGIAHLQARIRELASCDGRLSSVRDRVFQLAVDLSQWLGEYRDSRRCRLTKWWRPDSWTRWRVVLPGNQFKKELTGYLGGNK